MPITLANNIGYNSVENKKYKKATNTNLAQKITYLIAQMQKSYDFSTQIINSLFNSVNMVENINEQVCLSLEKIFYAKNNALNVGTECFEELQNMVSQGQFSQENTNVAFSLANTAQIQAQAIQNFANATFVIRQRILDIIENNQHLSAQNIFAFSSQADNLASSVQSLAESAQSYYYSIQNHSEKIQEKVNQAYKSINDVSNALEVNPEF